MRKLLPLLLLFTGCYDDPPANFTFQHQQRKADALLVFAVDPTSPYRDHLLKESGLYRFWVGSIANYKNQVQGITNDLVIAPIAGDDVTWFHGTAQDFQEAIDSPETLRALLSNNSKAITPYQGLADTVEYLLRLDGVADGRTPVYLVVMSSMVDNSPRDKLVRSLKRFRQARTSIAFYWPNRNTLGQIDSMLEEAGYPKTPWEDCFNPPPMQFTSDVR